MRIPALLERVVARTPLGDHDGRSGATLERLTLDDGSTLVFKTADPNSELGGALALPDSELVLWQSGAFDRFPASIRHPLLDKWVESGQTVTLMRDLGDTVPGWSRTLSRHECERVFEAAAALHDAFVDAPPEGLLPFVRRLGLLSPQSMDAARSSIDLVPHVLRGWRCFHDLVENDVAAAVAAIHRDPSVLATAFGDAPATLVHADLWTVNLAIDDSNVTFLDWSLATVGPPAIELSVFLSGAADHCEPSREELVGMFRDASGLLTSDRSMRLALFAGLCDLGWNKALDAAEHDDPNQRARASADLAWWVEAGRRALPDLAG